MTVIKVQLQDNAYPIRIDSASGRSLGQLISRNADSESTVFVVMDAQVFALYGRSLVDSIATAKRRVIDVVIPPGERSKSPDVLHRLYSFLLDQRVSRRDFILAVGGGVTTDLAGYAAATSLRGLAWAAVPTTLVGMVDAAIGGKTGINHPLGKNLIGAFWQPSFVLIDPAFLATLPAREFAAGLGEVAKYAGLVGGDLLEDLDAYLDDGDRMEPKRLRRLIARSAAYKAEIVSRDEREKGPRMLLNLGHTIGHAIEKSLGYGRLLHGEAVILGLDAAAELSIALKPSRRGRLAAYQGLIRNMMAGLPRRRMTTDGIIEAMALDKKRTGAGLRFVLLDAPGRPIIGTKVPSAAVHDAVAAMLEHYES